MKLFIFAETFTPNPKKQFLLKMLEIAYKIIQRKVKTWNEIYF